VAKSAAQLRADIKRRTAANARDRAALRKKAVKKKPAAGAKKRATARRATAAKARGRKKAANRYVLDNPYVGPTKSRVLRSTGSRRNATEYQPYNKGYNSFMPRAQRRR